MLFAPLAATAAIGVGKAIVGEIAKAVSGAGNAETGATATTTAAKAANEAKARKASTDFESMFLEQTVDRLAQSEGTEGPLGDSGTGGGVYRSMLTKEYAGQIVKSGGVGIADQVFREMMKMQEGTRVGAN
nr:rod-binding protein [Methylobacterium sp. BTF04]